ncbi:uncharacterized protein LOC105182110 [Harpegnathos saltator]|uniref:uncharacterized protein LOC105182110 n=1 Tax=Harpegnathos saltator TaxID=610380 RepID=UPI00058CB0E8|nr:uncharacterized protein LOC105182110 [Harpegnathos saltator]
MKILIIVGILFFTTMTCSYNVERSRRIMEYIHICQQRLDRRTLFRNLFLCIILNDGQVLTKGQFNVNATSRFIKDIIADKKSVRKARALFNKCYKNEQLENTLSPNNRTVNIAICTTPIIHFFSLLLQ